MIKRKILKVTDDNKDVIEYICELTAELSGLKDEFRKMRKALLKDKCEVCYLQLATVEYEIPRMKIPYGTLSRDLKVCLSCKNNLEDGWVKDD